MADVIPLLESIKLSRDVADFVMGMTREESAWVYYWSKIYYDLALVPEAAPEETLEFVNCILKGALFQYNDKTMKAIEILKYFGVHSMVKSFPRLLSRGL